MKSASASKVQGAMKYVMNDAAPVADDAGTTRNIYPGAINQQPRIQESSCVWNRLHCSLSTIECIEAQGFQQ